MANDPYETVESYLDSVARMPMNEPPISQFWISVINESCGNLTQIYEQEAALSSHVSHWEFSSALFLCMTILTTIGKHFLLITLSNQNMRWKVL